MIQMAIPGYLYITQIHLRGKGRTKVKLLGGSEKRGNWGTNPPNTMTSLVMVPKPMCEEE